MTRIKPIRKVAKGVYAFHMRWRWLITLVIVLIAFSVLFGAAEFWKGLFGLALEQVCIHLGAWDKLATVFAQDVAEDM